MRLKILGCSGGIGDGVGTTSFLLDNDVLIDAGTGVGNLTMQELIEIDHVFLTHAHLDHVAFIPFILDTVGSQRKKPLIVYTSQPTQEILKQHLFNWHIWPDFTRIPDHDDPFMRYEVISVGETVELDGRKITPLPANHVVPAVGFQLDSGKESLVFTGDTTTSDALWEHVNKIDNLRYLIIESAFSNRQKDIAIKSKHLCPELLVTELDKLQCSAEIYITHLKRNDADLTMHEIESCAAKYNPRRLMRDQLFEF